MDNSAENNDQPCDEEARTAAGEGVAACPLTADAKGDAAACPPVAGAGADGRHARRARPARLSATGEGVDASDACDTRKPSSPESAAVEAPAHFMYVLECVDGSLYTGYAVDVRRRLDAHNAGRGAKYTRARRPVTLLAYAGFATKHDAMHAEYRFKQLTRDEKDALLARAARTSLEEALAPILG